jgi:PKHD-type hydroxylase
MFLEIPQLLTPSEVARLTALSRELNFVDGKVSNAGNPTKTNLQADLNDPRYGESSRIVAEAFGRSQEFAEFAFPKTVAPPMLSRYDTGMKYGPHADSAYIMDGALRSDLSCTVFLSDPESYEGGELVIHLGTVPVILKGQPGEAIVYPSTMLHEVRPVRSGSRLVSITFIESRIADENRRTQLYELGEVAALEGNRMTWQNRIRLQVVYQNLTRMWTS